MGRNHHRRTKQPEQENIYGWMSGFINLFDFRRSGSNQRLPSERRYRNKVLDSRERYEYDSYDISQPIRSSGKQSEEMMIIENNKKHKRSNSFMEFIDFANDADADANTLVREILIRIQKKNSSYINQDQKDTFRTLPEKIRTKFITQLTDATKILLHDKLLIGKVPIGLNGKSQYSREFIDAFETLLHHKELLFKLLEDPNSELSESINHLINSELGKLVDHDRKYSNRNGYEDLQSYTSLESVSVNNFESETKRIKSLSFTFAELKRRLKRAMFKNRKDVHKKKDLCITSFRRHLIVSPSTNPHLEDEIHPKRVNNPRRSDGDFNDMLSENERIDSEVNKKRYYLLADEILYQKYPKRGDIDLMLKCFSMPDRTRSPSLRPDRRSSLPAGGYIRLDSFKKSVSSVDDSQLPEKENIMNAAVFMSDHSLVVSGDGEVEEKLSTELSSAALTAAETAADGDEEFTPSLQATSLDKTEQLRGGDGSGGTDYRPSPMSVLEPIDSESELTPIRSDNIQDKTPVTPLRIRFNDDEKSDKNLTQFSYNNEAWMKNYITEILTATDFSWNTFYLRYLTSDNLIDISPFDAAEDDTYSDQIPNDYMIITFDLLNEVLEDECGRYFSYSPWISASKSGIKVRPIPETENSFQEILKQMESHLNKWSDPEDVEEIITKEIFSDRSLTDFQSDFETIGGEIADLILQKLVTDTVSSCFSFTDKARMIHV